MTKYPLLKPADLPGQQNKAEKEFVRCMAEGKPCIIGDNRPPEAINDGENANVIRAELIRFFIRGGIEDAPIKDNLIALRGAHISGQLHFILDSSHYGLILMNCHFHAPVMMLHSAFRLLNLSGSYFPFGFNGRGMKIEGNMFMKDGFCVDGAVDLCGASIGGDMDCEGGKFKNKDDRAFVADRIKVGGNVAMGAGFVAEGDVCLSSADIGGQLRCDGGIFKKGERSAFLADGISVKDSVLMRNGFCADGEVRFINANISGQLRCDGGVFKNKDGRSLVAAKIKVGDDVSLQNGFFADGAVYFPAADIGGNFICDNANFKNEGISFAAQRIKVGGNLTFQGKCYAEGSVLLSAADIKGNLHCNDGEFKKGFNAKNAKVGGFLHWNKVRGEGTVDLSFVIADVLEDGKRSRGNFYFRLNGFSYKRFQSHGKVESRIEWLDRRPANDNFSSQPFEQAARVLFAMGKNKDARNVLFVMEQRITEEMANAAEEMDISRADKFKRWILDKARRFWGLTTGYNYRLRRMVITSVVIVVCGAAFFELANYYGYIVPHQPVVLAHKDYKQAIDKTSPKDKCLAERPTEIVECLFPEYPRFNSLSFSADVFIPVFALHQEPYWYPQPGTSANTFWEIVCRYIVRGALLAWYWFEIIAGWVLTSLFVLTFTGILRKRQEQAEGK